MAGDIFTFHCRRFGLLQIPAAIGVVMNLLPCLQLIRAGVTGPDRWNGIRIGFGNARHGDDLFGQFIQA